MGGNGDSSLLKLSLKFAPDPSLSDRTAASYDATGATYFDDQRRRETLLHLEHLQQRLHQFERTHRFELLHLRFELLR